MAVLSSSEVIGLDSGLSTLRSGVVCLAPEFMKDELLVGTIESPILFICDSEDVPPYVPEYGFFVLVVIYFTLLRGQLYMMTRCGCNLSVS